MTAPNDLPPVGATFADVKVGPFRGIRVLRHTAEGEARWGFLVDDCDGPLPVESGFTDHNALSLAWRLQQERDGLKAVLAAFRALAVEAKVAFPDIEDGTVAIGPAIRITRELATLAPKEDSDE